jgi:hypothetical protein
MPRKTTTTAQKRQASKKKAAPKQPSKLDRLEALLCTDAGASIAEMVEATGWQAHSVRGAMAGALKKRGLVITSEKVDGTRRYSAERG